MTTSIAELLEHFRDDVHLQPLFQQLDALSERVKVGIHRVHAAQHQQWSSQCSESLNRHARRIEDPANFQCLQLGPLKPAALPSDPTQDAAQQNASDPRALGASLRPSSPWSTRANQQQGGGLLSPRGSRSMGHAGSEQTRAAQLRAAAVARAGSRPSRAEDALLPIPPGEVKGWPWGKKEWHGQDQFACPPWIRQLAATALHEGHWLLSMWVGFKPVPQAPGPLKSSSAHLLDLHLSCRAQPAAATL